MDKTPYFIDIRVHPMRTVPKFIDIDFTKTSPKRSFSVIENKHFGLVFTKTGSINSGTEEFTEFGYAAFR